MALACSTEGTPPTSTGDVGTAAQDAAPRPVDTGVSDVGADVIIERWDGTLDATAPADAAADSSRPDTGRFDASGADAQTPPDTSAADSGTPSPRLPVANVKMDYQLGAAYPPPSGTMWVSRDRNASPAAGVYNVCYINGFQSQPDERSFWTDQNPDLILRDGDGDPVIDPDWNEMILDVRTEAKRQRLATIVEEWMEGCQIAGFDAIEIDNLDTYARSGGRITQSNAVAFMRMLSDRAHALGLAIAQKNSTEVLDRQPEMNTDFAIAEECNRWNECADYTAVYGNLVFVIEYRRQDFDAGCRDFPLLSIVYRDLNLVDPGSGSYIYDSC